MLYEFIDFFLICFSTENRSTPKDHQRAREHNLRAEGDQQCSNAVEGQSWQFEWHPKNAEDADLLPARQREFVADSSEPRHWSDPVTTQLRRLTRYFTEYLFLFFLLFK